MFDEESIPAESRNRVRIPIPGEKVRKVLGWTPAHDDLREMVGSALEWERYLMTRNR